MERKSWKECQIRLNTSASGGHTPGVIFREKRRLSQKDLFFQQADPAPIYRLPAALFPLATQDNTRVSFEDWHAALLQIQPAATDQCVCKAHTQDGRSFVAAWCQGVTAAQALQLQQVLSLQAGLYIAADEEAFVLGSATPPLYIHPLPRIISTPEERAADNTDPEQSMEYLLQRFVQQFTNAPDKALPHIAIATGYVYRKGLEIVLKLLENPKIQQLRLLFSGRGDRSTIELLEEEFLKPLDQQDNADNAESASLMATAIKAQRFAVQVYPHAFLHAKLYLGWEFIDDQGYPKGAAVVGSSNVTGPGLLHTGNLELNVHLEDRHTLRSLQRWFEARWEEAEDPSALLLEALESRRTPLEPPTFQIEGLLDIWQAGRRKQLVAPELYLDFLARLYRQRIGLTRVDLDQPPFPRDDVRQITPAPEQESGVLALAQRLLQLRFAFLADSVGLGKTITSLGTAWYLYRLQETQQVAVIAPKKLMAQWEADRHSIRMPDGIVTYINRHVLERMTEDKARETLAPYDLILVEEAHQMLRSRNNKLWSHLRTHLSKRLDTRLLLISATPWNNSREDIFNYILLGWHDGRSLYTAYPVTAMQPVQRHLEYFSGRPGPAARQFNDLALSEYRAIFGETFVQRTRHRIAKLYQSHHDFPIRNIKPYSLPTSPLHDTFFALLQSTLEQLYIPYREPFRALQRAAAATLPSLPDELKDVPDSNLHRSFIIQLYKRAESSFFALAVSINNVLQRLESFEQELVSIVYESNTPRQDLQAWMERQYLKLQGEMADIDTADIEQDLLSTAEKIRFGHLTTLFEKLDDQSVKAAVRHMIQQELASDQTHLQALQQHLDLPLHRDAPKGIYASELLKLHHEKGLKMVFVAGYTDTAIAAFVRAIEAVPTARIGLAMGGNEGWIYDPQTCQPSTLSESEWQQAIRADSKTRRKLLLDASSRAKSINRSLLLGAFCPRAQQTTPQQLDNAGGEVDILIGSEAISIGQNLQDATALFQLDLPWNPMVIEQRIGRVDRRGGGRHKDPNDTGSPKIVDIYYSWSHAAIENEIALRDKLKTKTEGAVQDTRFDELLLYELRDLIESTRNVSGEFPPESDPQDQLATFLRERQEDLVAKRTLPEDITEQAGALIEGIRHLATWAEAQQTDLHQPPIPVVACGIASTNHTRHWLLTLQLQPKGREGNPLGPPIHENLLLSHHLSPELDLEALVLSLQDAATRQAHRHAPSLSPNRWDQALQQLEDTLLDFQQSYLQQHNERINTQAATTKKQIDPSAQFRTSCQQARIAIQHELKTNHFYKTDHGKALLLPIKEELGYLLRQLTPENCHKLLQDNDERTTLAALALIDANTRKTLQEDFTPTFLSLVGPLWAEDQSAAPLTAQTQADLLEHFEGSDIQRAAEGRWTSLDIRVLAAASLT